MHLREVREKTRHDNTDDRVDMRRRSSIGPLPHPCLRAQKAFGRADRWLDGRIAHFGFMVRKERTLQFRPPSLGRSVGGRENCSDVKIHHGHALARQSLARVAYEEKNPLRVIILLSLFFNILFYPPCGL